MRELSRWPLLLGCVLLAVSALGVDVSQGATSAGVVAALLALSAVCLGAFVYAEGARHREWWQQPDDTPTGPAAGQDDQQSG